MRHSAKLTEIKKDGRLKRLATRIDELARKDELFLRRAQEITALRRAASGELHRICQEFVESVNQLLSSNGLLLDPPEFSAKTFRDDGINLFQISVRGRILQVEHEATVELTSTEDFRVPYTLAGSVRAFNQELLNKDLIDEQLLFYTIGKGGGMWRFFDARTYRTGAFDQEYLISLMEQII